MNIIKIGLWLLLAVVVGAFLLSFPFITDIVYDLSNHLLSWVTAILFAVLLIVSLSMLSNMDDGALMLLLFAVLSGLIWVSVLVFQGPVMLHNLYLNSEYVQGDLVPQVAIRDVPYTVASTNFTGTNPEAMTQPGDLDYVQGVWIASIDPKGFWNQLSKTGQGFFVYDPEGSDPVVRITQKMPFAENGLWMNSAKVFVRSEKFFAEFHEVLYINDSETGEMTAVISLIKRQGFSRWPYVANIMLVSEKGQTEILTVSQAEAHPMLSNIALKPEWLASLEVKAYGYRNGAINTVFSREGRIQVQKSAVNDENSAPFHLETIQGNMWVTPFSPLRSDGMIGIATTSSHDINGPVTVWELPKGQAYLGADKLASLIEGAPAHRTVNWFRSSSNGDDGTVTCGNMTILEMVPVVRLESGIPHLYYLGYVSTAPNSVVVLYYSIVDPKTQIVYNDLTTDDQVESWLRGEFELQPQTMENSSNVVVPAGECVLSDEISDKSSGDLFSLIDQVLQELENRSK